MRALSLRVLLFLLALGTGGCGGPSEPEQASRELEQPAHDVAPSLSAEQVALAEALGVPVSFENSLGMRFVLIPAAPFVMGQAPGGGAAGRLAAEPAKEGHEVHLAIPYYLQQQPMTRAQLQQALPGAWADGDEGKDGAPVVTFAQAQAAALAVGHIDPSWAYRLPTEAQWEFAARAGGGREPPGHAYDLHRMADEGREWCGDWYGDAPSFAVADPTGPSTGTRRVVRGGSGVAALWERHHQAPESKAGVRLMADLGYGLGRRGSCRVTFDLVRPEDGVSQTGALPVTLRFIRMQDRLGARTLGVDPYWVPMTGLTFPVELRMIPGKYYVYCETGEGSAQARGIEIKFHVHDATLKIAVPLPEADRARYGSSRPQ